jgi:hypothetical protein
MLMQRATGAIAAFCLALPLTLAVGAPGHAQTTFTDATVAAGLVSAGGSRGAAWGDFDKDGCIDVAIAKEDPIAGGSDNLLYKNNCDGTFTDVTAAAGISDPGSARGIVWGDYDNDHYLDLYIGSQRGGNVLYHNNQDGTFTDVSVAAGVADMRGTFGVAFGDFNHDGWLDIFCAARFTNTFFDDTHDSLYRNNGNGTFTEVSAAAGVRGGEEDKTFMGVFADLNNDGLVDLWKTVDFGDDVFYTNNGDGTFTDSSAAAGVADPQHGMGITIGDANHNGCLDVIATNNTQGTIIQDPTHDPTFVYAGNCDGTFNFNQAGILDRDTVEWGINLVDYDNDEDEDLSIVAGGMLTAGEPNVLYENDGTGFFNDVTVASGTENNGASFGSTWVDYDNDGDLDWFVTNEVGSDVMFQNDGVDGNHLRVLLHGRISNSYGVGAEVRGLWQTQQFRVIQAGESFLSSEEQSAWMGMGADTMVERLEILWPSGVWDVHLQVPAGNFEATEGEKIRNGARLNGLITDLAGLPVEGASVWIQHLMTREIRQTVSEADGRYRFKFECDVPDPNCALNPDTPDLLPGTYRVLAFKSGFRPGRGGVELELDEIGTSDLRLVALPGQPDRIKR